MSAQEERIEGWAVFSDVVGTGNFMRGDIPPSRQSECRRATLILAPEPHQSEPVEVSRTSVVSATRASTAHTEPSAGDLLDDIGHLGDLVAAFGDEEDDLRVARIRAALEPHQSEGTMSVEEVRLLDMGVKAALGLLDKSDMGPMDRGTVATVLTRCFDAYAALRSRTEREAGERVEGHVDYVRDMYVGKAYSFRTGVKHGRPATLILRAPAPRVPEEGERAPQPTKEAP